MGRTMRFNISNFKGKQDYLFINIYNKGKILTSTKGTSIERTDNFQRNTNFSVIEYAELNIDILKSNTTFTTIEPDYETCSSYKYSLYLRPDDALAIERISFEQVEDAELFFELVR